MKGKKSIGSRVAVVGGGNSAIDAARVAQRLGAEVTILYRRLRQDMPAAEEEIAAAEHEGVKIEYLVAPLKITGKNGKAVSITCQRMKLGDFDSSGRKRPVPIKGSEFTLEVDAVVSAIGQVPDLSFVPEKSGISDQQVVLLRSPGGQQVDDHPGEGLRRRRRRHRPRYGHPGDRGRPSGRRGHRCGDP